MNNPGVSPEAGQHHAFGDRPNFILRGARLATITVMRPFDVFRVVGRFDAGEHGARLGFLPMSSVSFNSFVGTFDMFGIDDLRNAQVDLG